MFEAVRRLYRQDHGIGSAMLLVEPVQGADIG
jgi:hypothetical protein